MNSPLGEWGKLGGNDEMEGYRVVRRAKANNMHHVCLDLTLDPRRSITSISYLFCYRVYFSY